MLLAVLRARSLRLIRIAVAALTLVVALGSSMPAWARMLAGAPAHVCHCETTGGGHAYCACPICFPELESLDDDAFEMALEGRCGDADRGWRAFEALAVPPGGGVVVLEPAALSCPPAASSRPASRSEPPDPRPPRTVV